MCFLCIRHLRLQAGSPVHLFTYKQVFNLTARLEIISVSVHRKSSEPVPLRAEAPGSITCPYSSMFPPLTHHQPYRLSLDTVPFVVSSRYNYMLSCLIASHAPLAKRTLPRTTLLANAWAHSSRSQYTPPQHVNQQHAALAHAWSCIRLVHDSIHVVARVEIHSSVMRNPNPTCHSHPRLHPLAGRAQQNPRRTVGSGRSYLYIYYGYYVAPHMPPLSPLRPTPDRATQ